MWKLDRNALPENEIAARWAMFGPPPVMSSENKDGYDKLRNACVAYYRPTDARQLAWIRELVDTQWEILRYHRYRTAAIARYHQLRMSIWRKHVDPIIEKKKRELRELLPAVTEFDILEESVWRLHGQFTKLEATIEKLLEPGDARYRLALEEAGKYVDRLEKWLKNASARRNILLKIVEYFCHPLDQEAAISEADFKETQQGELNRIAAPSGVPPDSVTGNITTDDHLETVAGSSAATDNTNARN